MFVSYTFMLFFGTRGISCVRTCRVLSPSDKHLTNVTTNTNVLKWPIVTALRTRVNSVLSLTKHGAIEFEVSVVPSYKFCYATIRYVYLDDVIQTDR